MSKYDHAFRSPGDALNLMDDLHRLEEYRQNIGSIFITPGIEAKFHSDGNDQIYPGFSFNNLSVSVPQGIFTPIGVAPEHEKDMIFAAGKSFMFNTRSIYAQCGLCILNVDEPILENGFYNVPLLMINRSTYHTFTFGTKKFDFMRIFIPGSSANLSGDTLVRSFAPNLFDVSDEDILIGTRNFSTLIPLAKAKNLTSKDDGLLKELDVIGVPIVKYSSYEKEPSYINIADIKRPDYAGIENVKASRQSLYESLGYKWHDMPIPKNITEARRNGNGFLSSLTFGQTPTVNVPEGYTMVIIDTMMGAGMHATSSLIDEKFNGPIVVEYDELLKQRFHPGYIFFRVYKNFNKV